MSNLEESINLSAWLGCNVNQAFTMFTNKEHLQSWLPVVANVEPKVGGVLEISWASKTKNKKKGKKKKTTMRCKILAYEPNKYIAFEWKGPVDKAFMNSSEQGTQVSIYFLPINVKKKSNMQFTEVHLTLTGWETTEDGNEARKWFEDSWANAFEKLIEHVNDIKEKNFNSIYQ